MLLQHRKIIDYDIAGKLLAGRIFYHKSYSKFPSVILELSQTGPYCQLLQVDFTDLQRHEACKHTFHKLYDRRTDMYVCGFSLALYHIQYTMSPIWISYLLVLLERRYLHSIKSPPFCYPCWSSMCCASFLVKNPYHGRLTHLPLKRIDCLCVSLAHKIWWFLF